jgi:hypothetical protein
VRFGLLRAADIKVSADAHEAKHLIRALSIFSGPALTTNQIARKARQPHGQLRESTIGQLRHAGYEVTTPARNGHCLILLAEVASADEADILDACFDSPIPNPHRGGRH